MAAPYRIGDEATRFVVQDDQVLVYTTRITEIEQTRPGEWKVWDHANLPHLVDEQGVGKMLVPMEPEWRRELDERGEGFAIVDEGQLRGLELVQEIPPQQLGGDGREY